ncbi:MAG TPA: hypothetical protein VJ777_26525 [Mycobacterium sp.]|nr:hypothetical protein [Mycobacterium sp.]
MPEPSILLVLRERAGLQPDDTAFTSSKIRQGACVEPSRHAHFTRMDA